MTSYDSFVYSAVTQQAQQSPVLQQQQQAAWLRCKLRITDEAVWPEDERLEAAAAKLAGGRVPELAHPEEAAVLLQGVVLALPDRCQCSLIAPPPSAEFDPDHYDYFAFSIVPSFAADESFTLRRMNMAFALAVAGGRVAVVDPPVIRIMKPDAQWSDKSVHVGDVTVDLWKVFATCFPLLPPDLASVNLSSSLGWTVSHPVIQATGHGSSWCLWKVSDERIGGAFTSYALAEVPKGHALQVSVGLHVEVRGRVFAKLRRTYVKDVKPKTYVTTRFAPVDAALALREDDLDADEAESLRTARLEVRRRVDEERQTGATPSGATMIVVNRPRRGKQMRTNIYVIVLDGEVGERIEERGSAVFPVEAGDHELVVMSLRGRQLSEVMTCTMEKGRQLTVSCRREHGWLLGRFVRPVALEIRS